MTVKKPGLVIAATFEMAPRDREKTIELSRQVVAETRKEKGCLFYSFANDILDENVFRIAEGWTDEAALNAHLASKHIATFLAEIGRLNMLSIEAIRYNVADMIDMMAPQNG